MLKAGTRVYGSDISRYTALERDSVPTVDIRQGLGSDITSAPFVVVEGSPKTSKILS